LGLSNFSQDLVSGAANISVSGGGLQIVPNSIAADVIGGVTENAVTFGVGGATIAGGGSTSTPNRVTDGFGTVGGGEGNVAGNDDGSKFTGNAQHATVGGGKNNIASGAASTVPGGNNNTAAGTNSFAAGSRAKTNNNGTFIWQDNNSSTDFVSTQDN